MRFHYIAAHPDGKVTEGNAEAKGLTEVLTYLAEQGLRPISVKPIGSVIGSSSRGVFRETITLTDTIFLARYLALMLKIGTDLFKAIDILIADFDKRIMKDFLGEIRSSLEKGQPFYSVFARYPQYFSSVFVNMGKAGEAWGILDKVFDDLAATLEKEKELKGKLKAALVYPAILAVLSLLVLLFLVTFALPKIAAVFQGGGLKPPLFSRVVFAVGLFLGDHAGWIFGTLAVALVGGGYVLLRTDAGRKFGSHFIGSMPIVRNVVRRIALQRFAATLSSLMKAGLPILDALEITAGVVGKEDIRSALVRISREGVSKGTTLGEAFRREPVFPSTVTNLVAISEKAGHLDDILRTLSEFYESEINAAVKTLVAFVEPLMLMAIGGIVGLIALSIIIPIYQLVGQF